MPIDFDYLKRMNKGKQDYDQAKKASFDANGNMNLTNIPTATLSPVQQSQYVKPTSIQPSTTTQAQRLADTMAAYDRQGQQLKAEAYAQYRANRDATRNQIAQSYQSYQNQQATAGANAEQLKAMGMTGSGYADYMNAQNYNAYRQNVGNAYNTQATNDTSVANALQSNLSTLEQSKLQTQATYDTAKAENYSNVYTNILNAVSNGTYNDSMLDVLTSGGYIDDKQKATLSAMANTLMDKNKTENSNTLVTEMSANSANYNIATIDSLYKGGKLTDFDYQQAIKNRQTYSQNAFEEQVKTDPSSYNMNNLIDLVDSNEISKEFFNSKMQTFLSTNLFRNAQLTKAELDEAYEVFKDLHAEKKLSDMAMATIDGYYKTYSNEVDEVLTVAGSTKAYRPYNAAYHEFTKHFKNADGTPLMHSDANGKYYVEMEQSQYQGFPKLFKTSNREVKEGSKVKIYFKNQDEASNWMYLVLKAKSGR